MPAILFSGKEGGERLQPVGAGHARDQKIAREHSGKTGVIPQQAKMENI